MIGVYLIKHIESNKVYVGSSIDVTRRLRAHVRALRKGDHHNSHLQRAWGKYGEQAFVTDVLQEAERHELIEAEQKWIDALKAADARYGYNACPIAASVGSLPKSEEHRAKIGAAHKGVKRSEEAKARMSEAMRGKRRGPMSAETRAKISTATKGRQKTANERANISKAMSGKERGPCSDARREALRLAKLGRPLSEFHKRRILEGKGLLK